MHDMLLSGLATAMINEQAHTTNLGQKLSCLCALELSYKAVEVSRGFLQRLRIQLWDTHLHRTRAGLKLEALLAEFVVLMCLQE